MVGMHAGVSLPEIASLAEVYRFHDKEVVGFLVAHPQLGPLLMEARPIIARLFGDTTVLLEVIYHPEEDEDEAQLFAFIETRLGVETSMALLDRYRHGWWVGEFQRANGLLEFSLRYV